MPSDDPRHAVMADEIVAALRSGDYAKFDALLSDLDRLGAEELAGLERMAEKSASNLVHARQRSRETPSGRRPEGPARRVVIRDRPGSPCSNRLRPIRRYA